jgi:hypothetical protein
MSVRGAFIIAAGVVAATATGVLTWWASRNLAATALAGFPAFARTVEFLDRHLGEDAPPAEHSAPAPGRPCAEVSAHGQDISDDAPGGSI